VIFDHPAEYERLTAVPGARGGPAHISASSGRPVPDKRSTSAGVGHRRRAAPPDVLPQGRIRSSLRLVRRAGEEGRGKPDCGSSTPVWGSTNSWTGCEPICTAGSRGALIERAAANSSPRPARAKTTSNVPPRRTRIRPEKSMAVGPGCSITPADDQPDRRRSCARTSGSSSSGSCTGGPSCPRRGRRGRREWDWR
jgi:hypothetical protein